MPDLQTIWFLLVGVLLLGYALLDGFDLGVGMLHLFLGRDDTERRILINSIGPVWDGNEVWLLTAGGALFAAFPPVYATVFSGFYLALVLLLTGLILRAVSLEFRGKEDSPRWRAPWDRGFALGSFLPALLLGVALGNVMRGVPLDSEGEFAGSFLGLLNPFALGVGLMTVALFVMHGGAWLLVKTEGPLRSRAVAAARGAWVAFVAACLVTMALSVGAAPHLWRRFGPSAAWLAPLAMVAALALFPRALRGTGRAAFALSSLIAASALAITGLGLFPLLVPALGRWPAGLSIHNSASSPLTLRTMLVIALVGMPLVVAYTIFIYRQFRGPVRLDGASY
jgi:cytochrome d ubiquinol oxidase subunit II